MCGWRPKMPRGAAPTFHELGRSAEKRDHLQGAIAALQLVGSGDPAEHTSGAFHRARPLRTRAAVCEEFTLLASRIASLRCEEERPCHLNSCHGDSFTYSHVHSCSCLIHQAEVATTAEAGAGSGATPWRAPKGTGGGQMAARAERRAGTETTVGRMHHHARRSAGGSVTGSK